MPNENAAGWGQPASGEETDLTVNVYHGFQRSATTAAEDSLPRASSAAAPGEESVDVATDRGRFSHAESAEATEAELRLELQLEQIRDIIAAVIHDWIRLGRRDEARRRCDLLTKELDETSLALRLTFEKLDGELL